MICSARSRRAESLQATEVLIGGVFSKLYYNLLVGHIAKMFQYKHACHQADGLWRTAVVCTEERSERLFEERPVDHVCQPEQRMLGIQHSFQVPEKRCLTAIG